MKLNSDQRMHKPARLTRDQIFTLNAAVKRRQWAMEVYAMKADKQRNVWMQEMQSLQAWAERCERDPALGLNDVLRKIIARDGSLTLDEWLADDVAATIEAVDPSAPIFLLGDELDADYGEDGDQEGLWKEAELDSGQHRIVLWRDWIGFYGPSRACCMMPAGTKNVYTGIVPGFAFGMLKESLRPAQPRSIGTTERYALAKAKIPPRRHFYYVPNVKYDAAPVQAPKGGHHASPVAHDRMAHQVLLTRVEVDAEEAEELTARGYTLVWTEELPPEVLAGMTRRGKAPTPGTLNAYRWIERKATRVNADGEQAQRVTLIH